MFHIARFLAPVLPLACTLALLGCASTDGAYADARRAHDLVNASTITLATFGESDEHPDVKQQLRDACAVMIFPHVGSASFLVGGSIGAGILLVHDAASGQWVGPAFYALDEASVGPQVGLAKRELIVVMHRCDGLDRLRDEQASFRLGTSFTTQAAERGRGVEVARDVRAYSRVNGLYVGAALQMAVLRPRKSLSDAYYMQPLTVTQILSPDRPCNEPLSREIRTMIESATK
jgi:lipid-binding SYLF domain-containing protein